MRKLMKTSEFPSLRACVIGIVAATALLCSCAPPAEPITGAAKVIDGDSLEIGVTRIRLYGVDAFEGRQRCRRNGASWNCGAAAANQLRTLTTGREVRCDKVDVDAYGRTVAVCATGSVDLGAEMVRAGLALAYREYADDYVDEEDEARTARRGAWNGDFTAPWDDRQDAAGASHASRLSDGFEPEEDTASSGNCVGTGIKGNNRNGERIYHVPGSRSYGETKIDPSNGERWFCTEEEARSAGWRAPRGR